MTDLLPLFLTLKGRRVLLVGGGPVAAAKLRQLLAVGADVRVVAPEWTPRSSGAGVTIARRPFEPADLDGAWLVVAAATPEVNREVADGGRSAAHLRERGRRSAERERVSERRRPARRRDDRDLDERRRAGADRSAARSARRGAAGGSRRRGWIRRGASVQSGAATLVPMDQRRPLLLAALNRLYERTHAALTEQTIRSSQDPERKRRRRVAADSGGGAPARRKVPREK